MNSLDTAIKVVELISLVIVVPVGMFKIWRKIDERLTAQDGKLSRIEYALFNDGRGMEQQLKEVVKITQTTQTDVAVLKALRQAV